MIKKVFICSLICTALLLGSISVFAAPGTAEDPLVSTSLVNGDFYNSLMQEIGSKLEVGLSGVSDNIDSIIRNKGIVCGKFQGDTLPLGEKVNLSLGGSIILIGGSATLSITSGEVVDVSVGEIVPSGINLEIGHRYMAAENTVAAAVMQSESTVLLDGDARISEKTPTFTDVDADHWAFEAIQAMASLGIVNGAGNGLFMPAENMTRGQIVTVLGRYSNVDTGQYSGRTFNDVTRDKYYCAYVEWAYKNGIVLGVGDDLFKPDDPVDRSQMVTIIMRFSDFAGLEPQPGAGKAPFNDDSTIPSWAREHVYTAKDVGLVIGDQNQNFCPTNPASRAEACQVIYRLIR